MMTLTNLILGFFVNLPAMVALQISATQDMDPVVFVSANKLWCGQAQQDVANDAFRLYKSMPRGKLYDAILDGTQNCESLGYNFKQGEDPCYPGLQTFVRNEEEQNLFLDSFQAALKDYGQIYNFTLDDTKLLDSCKCKDNSYAIKYWGKSCAQTTKLQLLVQQREISRSKPSVMRTFISMDKTWCGQANASVAEDALTLYKSMPRGKLFQGVAVSDSGSCEDLGYKLNEGEDPCYPGLQTFFRDKIEQNKFFNSLTVTLKDYGERHNFTVDDAKLLDSCKCKDNSYARKYWGNSCERMTTGKAPHPESSVSKRTFISMNKKFCAQAPPQIAAGALALYKAMPRGKLYTDTLIHASDIQSCESLGYKKNAGEDPCYRGLQTFYRNDDEENQFMVDLQTTIAEFGAKYNLTSDDAALLDSCTCHVDSFALKYRGRSCALLGKLEASWVHREPNTGKKLACAAGPFVLATRALAVLKSGEEMSMHSNDQIAVGNCEKFGFPFRFPKADACFTGLHTWTATEDVLHDTLNTETQRTLKHLLHGGFRNYTESSGLDQATFASNPRCKCAPNSKIAKRARGKCDLPGARSHIREWWTE